MGKKTCELLDSSNWEEDVQLLDLSSGEEDDFFDAKDGSV